MAAERVENSAASSAGSRLDRPFRHLALSHSERRDAARSGGLMALEAFQEFLENILARPVDGRVMINSSSGNLPIDLLAFHW